MISSTQPLPLDDQLNESSLTENERIDIHHTADICEHSAFSKRFRQGDDEKTTNRSENQSYSDLQVNEQSQWEDELIHSSLPHFGSLDNKSKNNRQIYDYILDEEIQFIEELTISNINELSKQKDESQIQEFENQNKHNLLQDVRKTLPIYQFRTYLMQAIHDHQVLIIHGESGSGKTTQLTQYLYEEGYCEIPLDKDEEIQSQDAKNKIKKNLMIACTQSRHVATISAATRVAEEMNIKLGDEVGYSIRFQDCSSDRTIIKYITDEILLKEFLTEPDLASYSVLIIDEAHERTLHTDILFGLVKDIIRCRPKFKLLILSATLEAVKFSEFFDNAPIFSIPGRRFPVDIYYTKSSEIDYINGAIETVLQIHTTQPLGDILVFLTDREEIEIAIEILLERTKKLTSNIKLIILPIYPTLLSDMKTRIFEPTPPNSRKVVLATNIAETSLNIDGIHYVIDSGFCKQKTYNSCNGMESLMKMPISKVSANQRAGRAGRVGPGKCFRIYTAWTYQNELNDNTIPEIQRMNLANLVLLLKSLSINDPLNFNYMDPPSMETLHLAFEQLYTLGALNHKNELTKLGHRMAELPLDPMLSKTILTSEIYKCSSEILTILSMLFINHSIFYRPKDKILLADTRREAFLSSDGDHLTLLNIYNQWKNANYSTEWCGENFIQFRSMNRARQIRDQLERLMKRVKIEIQSNPTDSIGICKCICAGFFSHTAKFSENGIYKTISRQQNVQIHPNSCLFEQAPEYVIYFEPVFTTKEYMRQVIRIEKEWLRETASHFYETSKLDDDGGK